MKKGILYLISLWLVLIGALNWGLMGLSSFFSASSYNVLGTLFGRFPMFLNVIYVLVGVAAVIVAVHSFSHRK